LNDLIEILGIGGLWHVGDYRRRILADAMPIGVISP
jgi:hypothetical protein